MKIRSTVVVVAFVVVAAFGMDRLVARAQSGAAAAATHVAAAKTAAGKEHVALFDRLCPMATAAPASPAPAPAAPAGPPARATWHRPPAKVFDNLYYVGEIEYSAWALTTSEGIILIDAIFDYSVEEQVINGLKTLGLDPSSIRYVIGSHAHRDHIGGTKFLQDRGARIVMSADDWDLLERTTAAWPKPRRDMVATDGQQLTLGDTTITLYVTPGHTLGTISSILPVKDGTRTHTAAYWGGTAYNWMTNPRGYVTPERPTQFWFNRYIASADRFRGIVAKSGADVILSNHTNYDGSKTKLPALAARKPGEPHPYVIGTTTVQRYLTVASECAQAGLRTLGEVR